jgi:protein TonB
MGLLAAPPTGRLLSRRGGALSVVIALHVVAIALLLQSQIRIDLQPEERAISVLMLREEAPREAPPERPEFEPPPIEVVIPTVAVQIQYEPKHTITAAPEPPPPVAPPPAAVEVVHNPQPAMIEFEDLDELRPPPVRYPRAAEQARLQGEVMLWVQIDTEGRPREVRVHRSSGHEMLDRVGREAMLKAQFKPYRRNGQPMAATFLYPINFVLSSRTASRN